MSVCKHRVNKTLYFDCRPRGEVCIEFSVVGVVIELLLSFIDVIFFADLEASSFIDVILFAELEASIQARFGRTRMRLIRK